MQKLSVPIHNILYSLRVISKDDLEKYITAVTASSLPKDDIREILDNVFAEFPVECVSSGISFVEFQQVIGLTDFQAKLQIPL